MLHNLGAAVASALDDGVDALFGEQFSDWNAGDCGVADERDHQVAVTAKNEAAHVLHAHLQFLGNEALETAGIQNPSHADDPFAVETRQFISSLHHRIQRVGDYDENRLRRVSNHILDHIGHDLEIGVQQIVAAHAGLSRKAGRDNHDVAVGCVGVVVRAGDVDVGSFNGKSLLQIQRLALRHAFDYIDHHHVGQFLGHKPVRCS